jgi:hypothetical protein
MAFFEQPFILPALLGISVLLLLWNIFLQISITSIKKRQFQLFQGKEARNLEDILLQNNSRIVNIDKDIKELYNITAKIHALSNKGLHKVGMLRFNPFRDLGGDQSFSLAMLDGENNGVVLSSLYSRDGVRVYAKSINAGQSVKYPLTEEEKQVVLSASIEKMPLSVITKK